MLYCVYMLLFIFGTFSREPCINLGRQLLCVECVLSVAVYFGTCAGATVGFLIPLFMLCYCLHVVVFFFWGTTALYFFLMPRRIAPVALFTATHNCTHIPSHEIDAQQYIELFAS